MEYLDTRELWMFAIGLLVVRIVLGLLMAAHGAQKLFGWFGGHGLAATGAYLVQLGFPPGRTFAMTAAVGELVGGILLALGLLGPVGPAIMIGAMVVAMISVHWRNGLFAAMNGIELPLLYATGAFGIALAGFGPFSLDALLGLQSAWTPSRTWIVLAIGLLGGILNLLVRKQPNPPPM